MSDRNKQERAPGPRQSRVGLRAAAVVLTATAVPVASLVFASGVARQEVEKRALDGLVATAEATVVQERQAWDGALRIVTSGASGRLLANALAAGNAQLAAEAARNLLDAGPFATVRVIDPAGNTLAAEQVDGAQSTPVTPQETIAPNIGDPVTSGNRTVRQVGAPITRTGQAEPLGRLVVDVDISQILGDPSVLAFGETGSKFLISPEGVILAGSDAVGTVLLAQEDRELARAGKPATRTIFSPFYDRLTVEAYQPLPEQNLGILVQQARSEVMGGADRLEDLMHLAALAFALLGSIFAMVLGTFLISRSRRAALQERRMTDEHLRAEAKFRGLLESAPDAIVVVGTDGRISLINRQTEALFGYSREELVGESVEKLIPDRLAAHHPQLRGGFFSNPSVRAMGANLELAARRKDGSEFPVDISLSPIETDEGVLVSAAVRDVTERKRAEASLREREEQLAAARDQALEGSRLKSQFLANMSHEIRTPMNGVLGMAQLVLTGDLDPEQRSRMVNLRKSGETLLTIINDILDFSKMEAGKLDIQLEDFELRSAIDSSLSLITPQAEEKGLVVQLRVDEQVPQWVRGDSVRLRQILINILGNAVKFTEKGTVDLAVSPVTGGGSLRFTIRDTGIGMNDAVKKRLLVPFSQGDASTTRRFGGTGLGLAISRQLVGLMDGLIDFSSEPGAGSTFWFELPLPAAEAPTEAALGEGEGDEPLGSQLPGPVGADCVLLVDDARINRQVGAGLLRSIGYEVEIASSGVEAVAAVRNRAYSAILMDCLMPDMDGYEATRRIRAMEKDSRHTPIIALTAAAMSGDRERCLAAGMDDYISKPLDIEELRSVLTRRRSRSSAPVPAMDGGPDREALTPADRLDFVFKERLSELAELLSEQGFQEVCREFLSSTPQLIGQLRTAVGARESDETLSLAHQLKGSMATFGAAGLCELARSLEIAERSGVGKPEDIMEKIDSEYVRTRAIVVAVTSRSGGLS